MTDPIIFKTNGEEKFSIPFSPYPYVETKCPETKLEVKEMTEIDPSLILKYDNHIYYHGEKYQKVEEPKTFYDKVWEELGKKVGYGIDCDELTDRVMDLIKDNIPEPLKNKYHSDIIAGYNNALNDLRERF